MTLMRNQGAPSWMVTFADLMALMMTFFVLLYSFSVVDEKKYQSIVESMSKSFNRGQLLHIEPSMQGTTTSKNLIKLPSHTNHQKKETLTQVEQGEKSIAKSLMNKLQAELREQIENGLLELRFSEGNVVITFPEKITFASGSDELNVSFSQVSARLASILGEVSGYIIIAGHTDDVPISTERFRSNWDLSTARAVSIAHALTRYGHINTERMIVMGHSANHPLAPNSSEQNRAKNRRVEISIINEEESLPYYLRH